MTDQSEAPDALEPTESILPYDPMQVEICTGISAYSVDTNYPTTTMAAIVESMSTPDCVSKNSARWALFSTYTGTRNADATEAHNEFTAVVLDVDDGNATLSALASACTAILPPDTYFAVYSSNSAKPEYIPNKADRPKGKHKPGCGLTWRVLVPAERIMTYAERESTTKRLMDELAGHGVPVGAESLNSAQIWFLPNRGKHYEYGTFGQRGVYLKPDVVCVPAPAPVKEAQAEAHGDTDWAKRTYQSSDSPIDSFNRAHDVVSLMQKYRYQPDPNKEGHWSSPMQESGSYATQVIAQRWRSLSGSDAQAGIGSPAKSQGVTGDAFDLFCFYEHSNDRARAIKAAAELLGMDRPQASAKVDAKTEAESYDTLVKAVGESDDEDELRRVIPKRAQESHAQGKLSASDMVRLLDRINLRLSEIKLKPIKADVRREIVADAKRDKKAEEKRKKQTDAEAAAQQDQATKPDKTQHTDLANAVRIKTRYADQLAYVYEFESWLVLKHVWGKDTPAGERKFHALHEIIEAEAVNQFGVDGASDHAGYTAHMEWALRSCSAATIGSAITIAKREMGVPVDKLDANPHLFGMQNGVYDLKNDVFMASAGSEYVTLAGGVSYEPEAVAPTWGRFVLEIMQGDQEMVGFLQRLAGYILFGERPEEKLVFFYGGGSNGKSTFTNILAKILGEYAVAMPTGALSGEEDMEPYQVAGLRGARLAVLAETRSGAKLNAQAAKKLAATDLLYGCPKYGHPFSFLPTHQAILQTNHKPSVLDTDEGIWRRLVLVDFAATFEGDRKDMLLGKKLEAELPGIFNWMLDGYRQYAQVGLCLPDKVKAASAAYRQSEDFMGQWLGECTADAPYAVVAFTDLYQSFTDWWSENGEVKYLPVTKKAFAQRLTDLGYMPVVPSSPKKRRGLEIIGNSVSF